LPSLTAQLRQPILRCFRSKIEGFVEPDVADLGGVSVAPGFLKHHYFNFRLTFWSVARSDSWVAWLSNPHPFSSYEANSVKPAGRQMRDLQEDEAAAVLCVSPDTLRAWEQQFGYPHPIYGDRERRYAEREVIALRDSLEGGLSVAAAVSKARGHDPDPLP